MIRFDHDAFAARVRARMEHEGWTRTDLSTSTGVNLSTVSRFLDRITDPTLDTVLTLCSFLELEPMSFVIDDGSVTSPAPPTTEESTASWPTAESSQRPGTTGPSGSREE